MTQIGPTIHFDINLSKLALQVALVVSMFGAVTPLTAADMSPTQRAELRLYTDRSAYVAGQQIRIAAVVQIEPGWHTNSNRPTLDFLIPTQLQFSLLAGWQLVESHYPPGELKAFQFASQQQLSVYHGEIIIFTKIALPDDVAVPSIALPAELRYQACSDRICLPPVTVRVEVEIDIGDGGEPQHVDVFAREARPAS